MEESTSSEPVFRAHKRRKVIRKRDETSVDDPPRIAVEHGDDVPHTAGLLARDQGEEEAIVSNVVRVQRKSGTRRPIPASMSTKQDTETALARFEPNEESQEIVHSDRFVRPTGKVETSDDRHMMAFIDSKLAEMRSAPSRLDSTESSVRGATVVGGNPEDGTAQSPDMDQVPASGSKSIQASQLRTNKPYSRPTKRRQPPPREETSIARDSMIDQIMRESQVPLYDHSASRTAVADAEGLDNDAATAEAFKAQLLADMELHRRRPPKVIVPGTSMGPKLGGSRAQRERMRQMEEAKGVSASKK